MIHVVLHGLNYAAVSATYIIVPCSHYDNTSQMYTVYKMFSWGYIHH